MHAVKHFKKRSYNFKTFFRDIYRMINKRSDIKQMRKAGRISAQFEKRIMLAVTAVNGCRYCEWGHTQTALKLGCSEEEIEQIMIHDFGSCDSDEVIGLAYAQHYAESEGDPSSETGERLEEFYGKEKAKDIQLVIEMIMMGNLLGNTLDAFESRFKGIPPEKGSFLFEFCIYVLALPFVLIFNNRYNKWKASSNPYPHPQY